MTTHTDSTFISLLLIAFIVLKLTHVIDWSWLWVLAPLWGGFLIFAAIFIGLVIFLK